MSTLQHHVIVHVNHVFGLVFMLLAFGQHTCPPICTTAGKIISDFDAFILTQQDQNSFSIQEAKTGRHHQAGSVPARWRSHSAPGKPRKSRLNRRLHS